MEIHSRRTMIQISHSQPHDAVYARSTAFTLKGIRDGLFWSHFKQPWARDIDFGYPRFLTPTGNQFHEVFIVSTE